MKNASSAVTSAPNTKDPVYSVDLKVHGKLIASVGQEFANADFGDRRLNKRCGKVVKDTLAHPECSIPTAGGTPSQASAVYRFLGNDSVTEELLAQAHHEQTRLRCQDVGTVLLISDSTTNGYGKDTKRKGLGPTTKGGIGFLAHVTLAVSEEGFRPLGVLAHECWVRPPVPAVDPAKPKPGPAVAEVVALQVSPNAEPSPPPVQAASASATAGTSPSAKTLVKLQARQAAQAKIALRAEANAKVKADKAAAKEAKAKAAKSRVNRKSEDDEDNESARWFDQAQKASAMLGTLLRIHVTDRESDDYKYFAAMLTAGELFVVRASSDRALGDGVKLFAKLSGFRIQLCRSVYIGAQPSKPKLAARQPRMAKLEISAGTIEIPRPSRTPKTTAPLLSLNYVLVQEIETPTGEVPVVWRLVSNLPIETGENIERIVDIYRKRWMIEEFFKALKTGCGFKDVQLESFTTLAKMFALLLPVATKLLEIRLIGRLEPDAPATVILTPRQIVLLRSLYDAAHAKKRLAAKPTARDIMYAIASLVGHFPNNGDPGWQILGRGLRLLLTAEEAAVALLPNMAKFRRASTR